MVERAHITTYKLSIIVISKHGRLKILLLLSHQNGIPEFIRTSFSSIY